MTEATVAVLKTKDAVPKLPVISKNGQSYLVIQLNQSVTTKTGSTVQIPLHEATATLFQPILLQLVHLYELCGIPKTQPLYVRYISGGHMAYEHLLVTAGVEHFFVKLHNPLNFSDQQRERRSRLYLQKEAAIYHFLGRRGYPYSQQQVNLYQDTMLILPALQKTTGWYWLPPKGANFHRYVEETLGAYAALQQITPPTTPLSKVQPSYQSFWEDGWDTLEKEDAAALLSQRLSLFQKYLSPTNYRQAMVFMRHLPQMAHDSSQIDRHQAHFFSHNDARPSNLAWHPSLGTRLIDWSWADLAPRQADSTTFLINLFKNQLDTKPYYNACFNREYALTLIGFWLSRCLDTPHDGSLEVRLQQLLSAVAAYQLCYEY